MKFNIQLRENGGVRLVASNGDVLIDSPYEEIDTHSCQKAIEKYYNNKGRDAIYI